MKRLSQSILFPLFISLMLSLSLSTCSDHGELYDSLPRKIASFVTQYFPGYGIDSYSSNSSVYHVRLDNGPGLTFNSDQSWIAINGYGLPLPPVLMFDQLPPALYVYLQETENTENVFAMERDGFTYTLQLLDSTVKYDIDSENVTVNPVVT